ncbi:MAG: hypothetical protein IKU07_06215 [Oscillospiraceae bacterium]|nr:hypothetical protein [Oscillospiraceae bacterium]
MFLTVLVGLLIPSTYISASPQEYIDINYFYDPIWYVVYTLCLSAGTFLVWMSVFYWLANPKFKAIFTGAVWILCGITVVNYMFFGTGLGVVTPNLEYTDGFQFALTEHILNIVVVIALAFGLLFLLKKLPKAVSTVLIVGCLALTGMSAINLVTISKTSAATKAQLETNSGGLPSFNLDKDGNNVIVIMLDRGLGSFVPYIFEEYPELRAQFDGFTNYTNTLSYGAFTNFATPSLYGGYDYTPVNINLRSTEKLVDKQNEALKVLPTVFTQEDYDVTVIDPSYAGYKWIPDLSIYDDMPGVSAYHADGKFNDMQERIATISMRKRNFFFFSLMKTMPVSLQSPIYDKGNYRAVVSANAEAQLTVSGTFLNAYSVLENLDTMTEFTSGAGDTLMIMRSNLTHEPLILQEPYLTPSNAPDNSAYYSQEGKTVSDGNTAVLLEGEHQISHYHVNAKALMQLGEWFETMKENGVYDNTRIIIVSDHGRYLNMSGKGDTLMHDTDFYRPLLLVKDFNAHGFNVSEEFMTNADVPTIAVEGLIENPVNPFTGTPINSSFKEENETQYVILSQEYEVNKNNGTQFLPSEWAAVTGDVRDLENWEFLGEIALFPAEQEN